MLCLLHTLIFFLSFYKPILAIPEFGPVDLPDGVKLNLHNRIPEEQDTVIISQKSSHNGGTITNLKENPVKPEGDVSIESISAPQKEDNKIVDKLSPNIDIMTQLLARLGVKNPPSIRRCTGLNQNILLCIEQVLLQLRETFQSCNEILFLNIRVLFGGKYTNSALSRLNTISAQPKNRQYLVLMGTSTILYFYLMRENISDKTRWMAQSVLAKLTDLPVASNIAELSTGGNGHINILLPSVERIRSADRYIIPQMLHII